MMTTPPIKRRPTPPQSTTKAMPTLTASTGSFDDLIDTRTSQGKFLMIYGEPGEGKTSLSAQFPNPLFITTSGEQGIFLLKQRKVVDTTIPIIVLDELFPHDQIPDGTGHPGWIKCLETLTRFRDNSHGLKTLVVDSTSGLQDLCFQHCASVQYSGDMDGDQFNGFSRGYTKAAESYWSSEFLPLCLAIVAKGLNVVLVAHSTYRQVENPSGPDYNRFQPALGKQIWDFTKKDLHGLFYLGREVMVSVDAKTKKKNTVGDRRFIGVSPSTYYVAKTWCTPNDEMEVGNSAAETWKNLRVALGM